LRARLYGRADCHLCEEMARTLRSLGVEFDEIDVDADARLKRRYGSDVPVLVDAHERELCRHRLDAAALSKIK